MACRTHYHSLYLAEKEPEIKTTLRLGLYNKRHLKGSKNPLVLSLSV